MASFIKSIIWGSSTPAQNPNSVHSIETFEDDWVEMNSTDNQDAFNPLEQSMILPAQKTLVNVANDITTCCSYVLSNDSHARSVALMQLNENGELLQPLINGSALSQLQSMQQQKSSKLVTVAVMTLKAYSLLKDSKEISPQSLKIIESFSKQVSMLTGINEKSPLYSLTQLSLEMAKMNQMNVDFDDYVMEINTKNEIELVKGKSVDHTLVSSELVKLVRVIMNEKTLTQFSDKVLLNLLYSSLYLFANYSKLLSKNSSLEGLQPTVDTLQQLIELLRNELESRDSKCPINPALLAKISTSLESIGYTNMDEAKSNCERLKILEAIIPLVQSVLLQSDSLPSNQLIRHPTEFEKQGVKLFQTSNKEQLIIIFEGDDNSSTLRNPIVTTERANHGISGTMLNCVKGSAEKKKKMLDQIMVRKADEFTGVKTVIITGFGVDGAAAEFVAALQAKNSNQYFIAVGVGTMNYLSHDAVVELQGINNLNSFNFTWHGDTLIEFNTLAAKALGNRQLKPVGVNIPIHCADVYMSDTLQGGHVKDIYANDIKKALGRAKLTYSQFTKLAQDIQTKPIAITPIETFIPNDQPRIINFSGQQTITDGNKEKK